MTRDDLLDIVTEAQVDPSYFSIGSERHEALSIVEEAGAFHVFLSERGARYEEQTFPSEDEACVYFLKRLFQLFQSASWTGR